MITMNETQAQRDAERVREHAPKLLEACRRAGQSAGFQYMTFETRQCINEAIEYATGAHDPGLYPEAGYEVDAAGTATGVSV